MGLNGLHKATVCLQTCAECQVQFLTSKSNLKRTDLRCPFGCRRRHTREAAAIRSHKRNQKKSAKTKKQQLNRKRSLITPNNPKIESPVSDCSPGDSGLNDEERFSPSSIWDFDILNYIRFLLKTVLGEKVPLIKIENQLKEVFGWILRPRTLQDRGG